MTAKLVRSTSENPDRETRPGCLKIRAFNDFDQCHPSPQGLPEAIRRQPAQPAAQQ
jgi:hypothetical protein